MGKCKMQNVKCKMQNEFCRPDGTLMEWVPYFTRISSGAKIFHAYGVGTTE